jgi:hypothetical protein
MEKNEFIQWVLEGIRRPNRARGCDNDFAVSKVAVESGRAFQACLAVDRDRERFAFPANFEANTP